MFGTFQIFFYNNNNTQTIIWRITWELQPMFTCTRFGLLKFVSKWQLPTTCSKRSRIGEFGISLFSNGFLVALLVPITHFVSFPLTRRFILRDSFHCKFHRRWRQLMRSFNSFKPWKTWEDHPVDITFERVAVFFAINFTRSRILMSLVELCEFRTLSAPVYAKHRHSRGRRAGILSICKSQRPFSKRRSSCSSRFR